MSSRRHASTSALVAALEPCASEIARLDHFPSVDEIDEIVSPRAGVRFVAARPRGRRRRAEPVDPRLLYDGRITLEGVVETRAGSPHDLWNALVWGAFPRSKRALHARQHRLIRERVAVGARALPGARTREQDTIAMVDEGGALLLADRGAGPELVRALASRSDDALDAVRVSFTGLVFGHAIYEEAAAGSTGALAFAVVLETDARDPRRAVAQADALLAGMLADPERFLSPEGHRGIRVTDPAFRLASPPLPSP